MKLAHPPLLLALALVLMATSIGLHAAPTWTAVPIGTHASPRGYWEFLPSAYATETDRAFPVVFYFHGLGEIGDGTAGTALNKVPTNEVARNLNNPADPIRAFIDQQGVIVLCPQYSTWWASAPIRAFIDYAKTRYRIDPRRIYLTGLSSGSHGVTEFMSLDARADEAAAFLVCAYRGTVTASAAARLSRVVPFWILTARGDWSNHPDAAVDLFAAARSGLTPPSCMANFPGTANTTLNYTGRFTAANTWAWTGGIDPADDAQPKLTVFAGDSHNSWQRVYTNTNTWTWLLGHQKPDLAITSPAADQILRPGTPVRLAATARDKSGQLLSGAQLRWSSQLDGDLGTGADFEVTGLRPGRHLLTCQAIDTKFHGTRATVAVTIPHPHPFTCHFDFGSAAAGFLTTAAGWNNITDPAPGGAGSLVANAVDATGLPVGVGVEIIQRFENPNTNGLTTSPLYPVAAQSDSLYVSDAYPTAQIRISGLNPGQRYDFTFFASRATAGNRITRYTINGATASLNASENTSQVATLADLAADASGQLLLVVTKDAGASFGYLGVMTIRTDGPAPATALQTWRALHGLAPDGADDLATPGGDGVPNLLKFAFNLAPAVGDLARPTSHTLAPDGNSGLPVLRTDALDRLLLTLIRRKSSTNPGIVYRPESAVHVAGPWTDIIATPEVFAIDDTWERATYADAPLVSPMRFFRVRVTSE